MGNVCYITHKGKQILHIDFKDTELDEIKAICEKAKSMICKHPACSLLTITDVSDTKLNPEVSKYLKDLAAHNKPFVKAGGVLGVSGIKKVSFNAVLLFSGRKNLHLFDNMEETKDWLVQQ